MTSTTPPPKSPEPDAPDGPSWGGLWRVIEIGAHNAFNDKVAQYILVGVASVVLAEQARDHYIMTVIALLILPGIFLAPLAGWACDRFSKRDILVLCSLIQFVVLLLTGAAFHYGSLWMATFFFFVMALQAAVFGPAKTGIMKELVGQKHLSAATGLAQMIQFIAFVVGQWLGGWMFKSWHTEENHFTGAFVPTIILAVISGIPLVLSLQIRRTPSHSVEKFRIGLLGRDFRGMGDLFRNRNLRLTALGVSFFWFAAIMVTTILLLQVAPAIQPVKSKQAEISGLLSAFVGIGVAAGSILVSIISPRRIELGLVPLGGLGMFFACLLAMIVDPAGNWFRFAIFMVGASSAVYLAPLNAHLQDLVDPATRGKLLSSAALLDSFGMIMGVIVPGLLGLAGLGASWQFLVLGLLCLGTAAWVISIIPQNFLRFMVLGIIRIVYRIRTVHADRLPKTGGVLLISNHVSYIDALVISAASEREVRFAIFEDFYRRPLLGIFLRLFGAIPISGKRAKDGIVAMADQLQKGEVVCLFPEGQITRTGMMNEVRKGFELIARRGGGVVLPVYMDDLWGSVFSYERGRFLRKHPHHFPYHINVVFGEPQPPEKATAEWARCRFRSLAAEALSRRGELTRRLDGAAAEALCSSPWKYAVIDSNGRATGRGELFAQARHLARNWRDAFPTDRVGVFIPEGGLEAVLANLGLRLAGRSPVNIDPDTLRNAAELATLMEREQIGGVLTTADVRAAWPAFPWPPATVAVDEARQQLDDLLLVADTAFAWTAPGALVRLRVERQPDTGGPGWIMNSPSGRPQFTQLTDADVLAQMEMVRSTDLLRYSDRLLCGVSFASTAGTVIGLWFSILRGVCIHFPPVEPAALRDRLSADDSLVAIGDVHTARFLVSAGRPLRSFLTFSEVDNATAAMLKSVTGAPVCPCLAMDREGILISVSMPDPPLATRTAEPQSGIRDGAAGRLLPGLQADTSSAGTLIVSLPSGRSAELSICEVDVEGYVMP